MGVSVCPRLPRKRFPILGLLLGIGLAAGSALPTSPASQNQDKNQLPAVQMTTPIEGASFVAPATVRLVATASDPDGQILSVEFFSGQSKVGESRTAPYEFLWKDVPAGEYKLAALATDDRGGSKISASVGIVVTAAPEAKESPAKTLVGKKEREAFAKKEIDTFRQAVKEAKTIEEKALAIQQLGNCEVKDSSLVPVLARYLHPGPQDLNFVLPQVAADALAGFRNEPSAAQALLQAVDVSKRCPYPPVGRKILSALASVGHESAVPVFEERLKAADVNTARSVVASLREMPPGLALDLVFRVWDAVQKENSPGVFSGPLDPLQPDLVTLVKELSGEPYTTMGELRHWWKKRGAAFKEKSAEKEKTRPLPKPRAGLPTALLVDLPFSEDQGATTRNGGTSAGMTPEARVPKPRPERANGPRGKALDWGKEPGPHAIDLAVVDHLKELKSFTIMGWLNGRAKEEGRGGNRVVTWLGREGVEVVWRSDGSLQLGINEYAQDSPARTDPGQVPPLLDEKIPTALDANWRFFAVTYDSTLSAGQVKFYIAGNAADPKLVATRDYARGVVGRSVAPGLALGNAPPASRGGGDRMFRGLMDQVRILGSTFDGSGALAPDQITNYHKW